MIDRADSVGRVCARIVFVSVALFALACPARAEERVRSLTTEIRIDADGAAAIHHTIVVEAEGDQIKRGVYFLIPRSIGPVGGFTVARDGAAELFRLDERELRIGAADVFLETGRHEYSVSYRAGAPFEKSEAGDLTLSWPPLVRQFELPWSETQVEISWPADRAPRAIDGSGARLTDGALLWKSADGGKPSPFRLQWDAGAFPQASARGAPLNSPLRYGAGFAALLSLLYFHSQWRARGKDLPPGAVVPRPETPRGVSAGACRYIKRMNYDPACMVAALASLAVKGAVSISVARKTKLRLASRPQNSSPLSRGERALKDALFAGGDPATLAPAGRVLAQSLKAHRKALRAEFGDRYFKDNRDVWRRGFFASTAAAAVIGAFIIIEARAFAADGIAVAIGAGAMLALVATPLVYYALMRAPTVAGRALMDEIDGLALYLKDATPLSGTGEEFVRLLPFAVALDAEKEWAARFGGDLPAAEDKGAQAAIDWYEGMRRMAEDATVLAAIIPAVTASSTGATVAGAGGGASAGGW